MHSDDFGTLAEIHCAASPGANSSTEVTRGVVLASDCKNRRTEE
jgi:hypothetical protein